jgi:hypothetical protein
MIKRIIGPAALSNPAAAPIKPATAPNKPPKNNSIAVMFKIGEMKNQNQFISGWDYRHISA